MKESKSVHTTTVIDTVAKINFNQNMFLASETIKRRKPAQLEMARLTRQAVEALECLNQRLGCQPHADGETGINRPKKAGSQ